MDLSHRHRSILKALVDDFITDNRPVGSKTLSEKHNFGLSPATIRNVFRDLEELGLIISRHHSGGRIPTEFGYRFYIDSLISIYELTIIEKQRIQEEYLKYQFELDQILSATCRILSLLSETASVVLSPRKTYDAMKHIELIHVSGEEILMILVTRSGAVINKNIFTNVNLSQESLYKISKFLNKNAKGFEIDYIFCELIDELMLYPDAPEEFIKIANLMKSSINFETDETVDLYIDGLHNLANFKNEQINSIESILTLFDDKKLLKKIFSEYVNVDEVATIIGEKEDPSMHGVSIVATSYKMGDKRIGSMGIIGPQRMDYNKALALVDYTSNMLSEMITRISR
ncbi:MAG: heat-inducible transcriptional repressor HrcA [Spirochaetota bacterium]